MFRTGESKVPSTNRNQLVFNAVVGLALVSQVFGGFSDRETEVLSGTSATENEEFTGDMVTVEDDFSVPSTAAMQPPEEAIIIPPTNPAIETTIATTVPSSTTTSSSTTSTTSTTTAFTVIPSTTTTIVEASPIPPPPPETTTTSISASEPPGFAPPYHELDCAADSTVILRDMAVSAIVDLCWSKDLAGKPKITLSGIKSANGLNDKTIHDIQTGDVLLLRPSSDSTAEQENSSSSTATRDSRIAEMSCGEKGGEARVYDGQESIYGLLLQTGISEASVAYLVNETSYLSDYGLDPAQRGEIECLPADQQTIRYLYGLK